MSISAEKKRGKRASQVVYFLKDTASLTRYRGGERLVVAIPYRFWEAALYVFTTSQQVQEASRFVFRWRGIEVRVNKKKNKWRILEYHAGNDRTSP